MALSEALGWVILAVVSLGSGFLGGALLIQWYNRRQLVRSTEYLLDRLKVLENDLHHLVENQVVLTEYLRRKGFVDDEDLIILRRELIDIPRQLEAEKNELLKNALDNGKKEQIIKDVPDTYH